MKSLNEMAFYSYRPGAWLRISGADAATYLQGQFTNDLRMLSESGVYGLWLNQKGKVLADSFVLKGNASDEFFILSYFSSAAVINQRLESYVIADEVLIEEKTAEVEGVCLLGTGGGVELVPPSLGILSFGGRRSIEPSTEWIFPKARRAEVHSSLLALGRRELSSTEMEYQRIEAGIPAVPQDIGPAELPNEGALETSAISYTKGCYLGQEVMARLKSMGQVRRRLLRVAAKTGTISALPAPLFVGERKVGELRSAAPDRAGGFVGLALLSLINLQPDAALALAPNGPSALQVLENP